jgi:hypothetical protein
MRLKVCGGVAAGLLAATALAEAQTPTRINVRVVSHDAKIIGSGVGGARVIVRDPATGRILAEGTQEGGTGDTQAILVKPVARGESIYATAGAAVVTVTIDLDRPKVLEFIGEGPLGYEHAIQRAVKQMLVVPGEDILGDGVVLELHGFIVELLEPAARPVAGRGSVEVLARVRMMCGCPHTPGGVWDANRVAVTARLYRGGELLLSEPLSYAGEPNMFRGSVPLAETTSASLLVVVASDPDRVNFGISPPRPVH